MGFTSHIPNTAMMRGFEVCLEHFMLTAICVPANRSEVMCEIPLQ
jgi:hypothetical protein